MKRTFINTFLLLSLALFLGQCKPELEGELGEPFDKVAGMSGTWQLTQFIQKDLNNPIKEERDLSYLYDNGTDQPLRINFNASDRSYSTEIINGKNFFGDEGVWAFDNDDVPSTLFLETESQMLSFELGSMVRPFDNQLNIELKRGCFGGESDTETVIYIFKFNRVSE